MLEAVQGRRKWSGQPRLAWLMGVYLIGWASISGGAESDASHRSGSESASDRVIEEVIVTAQKRAQSLQDVPISMSVIEEDFIAGQGMTDVRDVLLHIPNISFDTTTLFATPSCRGFRIDTSNRAFESPCGLALDGIPYARSAYFTAALFDIERVEALRGPQGTTFGKNTTAGLVHVISKDPGGELEGYVDVQSGELNRERYELALSGAVVPDLMNMRIAVLKDSRDGYVKNTTAAQHAELAERLLDREREGARVKFSLPSVFGTELQVTLEKMDLDSVGSGFERFNVPPELMEFYREYDPNADFIRENLVTSEDYPSGTSVAIERAQIDWSLSLSGWDIEALIGHSELRQTIAVDLDLSPAPVLEADQNEESPSSTLEIRAIAPLFNGLFGIDEIFGWKLGQSDFLVGSFYQEREINDSELVFRIHDAVFLQLEAAKEGAFVPIPIGDQVESVTTTFDEKSKTIAGFMQYQWHLSEQWTFEAGMRYSEERKEAAYDQRLSEVAPVFTVGGYGEFTAQESRKEYQFQPKLSVNYAIRDNIHLFFHWARGFKGGGYNAFVKQPDDPSVSREYDSEVAEEWGIDLKTDFFSNTLRINTSIYQLNVSDFQVLTLTFDETTGFSSPAVVNAAEARSQGVELDFTFKPLDWLTFIGAGAYNDTEFLEFPIGPCAQDRPNSDGDDDPRCDQTGEPFPFAPEKSGTLTMNIRYPLAWLGLDRFEALLSTTVEYVGNQFLSPTLDPRFQQSSFTRYKASVGVQNKSQGWSLRITGENLTDLRTSSQLDKDDTDVRFPDPPRLIFAQFRWSL